MPYNQSVEVFSGNVFYVKDTGENLIQVMDYTPAANIAVGSVVVVGNCPCIAAEIGPTGNGMVANIPASLRIRGGIYNCTVDGAIPARTRVYWNATTAKITLTETGNLHFGITANVASTANNQVIPVEHNPDGSPDPRTPTATVAAAGTNQGTAAALVYGFQLVTGATGAAGVGVILPTGIDGEKVEVKNADAANAVLLVYPDTGHQINALSANTAIQMAAKTSAQFRYLASTSTWYTLPTVPS